MARCCNVYSAACLCVSVYFVCFNWNCQEQPHDPTRVIRPSSLRDVCLPTLDLKWHVLLLWMPFPSTVACWWPLKHLRIGIWTPRAKTVARINPENSSVLLPSVIVTTPRDCGHWSSISLLDTASQSQPGVCLAFFSLLSSWCISEKVPFMNACLLLYSVLGICLTNLCLPFFFFPS